MEVDKPWVMDLGKTWQKPVSLVGMGYNDWKQLEKYENYDLEWSGQPKTSNRRWKVLNLWKEVHSP